jgi:hypothetical protein
MGLVLGNNPVPVIKNFLGVDKGDSVLFLVEVVLVMVPLEGILYHIFISKLIWILLWLTGPSFLPDTTTTEAAPVARFSQAGHYGCLQLGFDGGKSLKVDKPRDAHFARENSAKQS